MAPDTSQDGIQRASDEVAGGTSSHQALTRRPPVLVDTPDPSTPRASSEKSEEEDDAPGDRCHRKRKASWRSPQADSLDHRRRKCRREESAQGSTSSDGELSLEETDFSVSVQGGNDNRCPKRRIAETDVGASKWTLEEWRMLLTTGDASNSKESSNNDGKPQIRAKPSIPKAKWSAADTQWSIARSLRKKEAPEEGSSLQSIEAA
jgi:hypothetical protein